MNKDSKVKLSSGAMMPIIGLGVFKSPSGEETVNAVKWALDAGYRSIDAAAIYGNEEDVGEGIIQSGIPREEIFLTSKIWNQQVKDKTIVEAFEETLKKLKTDYLDMYMIHWPVGDFVYAWKELEKLYKSGRVKSIAVCNFNKEHMEELLKEAEILPVVNQIEKHPYNTKEDLIAYCEEKGILCEAWSPLGGTGGNVLEDETLKEIAAKYNKSPAQLIIRWNIQQGIIVIPKSITKSRIIENIDVFDFEISSDDVATIASLNRNQNVGPDPVEMQKKWA